MSKTIVITGVSSGIGKVTAEQFASQGWKVLGTTRGVSTNPTIYQLDVTNAQACTDVVQRMIAEHGSVDVLVNNAGYGLFGAFEQCSEADVHKQYEVNVFGMMNMCRAMLPHFRQRQAGAIVNISSMGGKFVVPYYGVYNSTKFAVEGFSEGLWHEVQPFGIRVKVVEPGVIRTDFYNRSKQEGEQMQIDPMYKTMSDQLWAQYAAAGQHGADSEAVARAIYHAATSRSQRLRYVAPWQTKLTVWLLKLLPHQIGLWLIQQSTTLR